MYICTSARVYIQPRIVYINLCMKPAYSFATCIFIVYAFCLCISIQQQWDCIHYSYARVCSQCMIVCINVYNPLYILFVYTLCSLARVCRALARAGRVYTVYNRVFMHMQGHVGHTPTLTMHLTYCVGPPGLLKNLNKKT